MVLGERLELSLPKELAPKASASAISPSEHIGILEAISKKEKNKNARNSLL